MRNPKTNVYKLRNGVLLCVFACFQDGREIIQTLKLSLIYCLMYLRIFVGVLCRIFVLLCITLCSFYFC